jgi:succinoglycan biosynthesis transport protein ExoP
MDQLEPSSDWRVGRPVSPPADLEGTPSESPGLKLGFGDVCYVLYRHKWLILFFSLAGLAAAAFIYKTTPKIYHSEAKVMVKYVADSKESLGPGAVDEQQKAPVQRGEAVVGSEIELLTSSDLAKTVAEIIGPARILAKLGGGDNLEAATRVIHAGTEASVSAGNVIVVDFRHPDPMLVQPVLATLVEQYFTNHYKVHRALANIDEFRAQREQAREELEKVDKDFLELKKSKGVFSLDDAKKNASERIQKIEELLSDATTEFAERQATLKLLPHVELTNSVPQTPEEHDKLVGKYAAILNQLELLRREVAGFLPQFKPGSRMIASLQEEIAGLEGQKKEIERQDPALVGISSSGSTNQTFDPYIESQRNAFLNVRISSLTNRLQQARNVEAGLYELEGPYLQFQRKRDQLQSSYQWYSKTVESAQTDSALGAGRFSNISPVEQPTFPELLVVKTVKKLGMAVAGGIGLGVGLAFLLELFLDQRIKRPDQLRRLLPIPVYLSIPQPGRNGSRISSSKTSRLLLAERTARPSESSTPSNGHDEALQPYFEALRDRILNRFDTLARKPKLVGVCGCADGQSATNTAAGLAAALSEAGDLKVLLVDAKLGRRTPLPPGGRRSCTLLDALEQGKRQEAEIAPNLFIASAEESDQERTIISPARFTTVVPRLNASDYDYIVFDMPPVDEISITPRLAKYMDLTLLVVEAGRAHRNVIKQAGSLLHEFTPNVATVLNNAEANLPKWLSAALAA